MRLRRFEAKNFKAIEHIATDWEELLVLIGENNCGKSSLLLALSWFLSGSGIRDELLFHKYETGPLNAIELVGYFSQLTDAEKKEVAVQGRMNGDEWILKKKFWFERAAPGGWKEALFSFSSQEEFVGWPNPDTSWTAFAPSTSR